MLKKLGDRGRRKFLMGAGASAASLLLGDRVAQGGQGSSIGHGLHGRYLTHVSVVRVNQIEVTPTKSIGEDEAADNRPERIRSRREAFARGCPDGRMTWAISWLALHEDRKEYQEARRLLAQYHDRYGDEVTFIPGGYFAPMYDTREHNRATIREALDGAGHLQIVARHWEDELALDVASHYQNLTDWHTRKPPLPQV